MVAQGIRTPGREKGGDGESERMMKVIGEVGGNGNGNGNGGGNDNGSENGSRQDRG